MSAVVNNPSHPPSQTQFSERLEELRAAWNKMRNLFSPQEEVLIKEIGGNPYFLDNIPDAIEAAARDNPHTPAVAQQRMQQLASDREQFLALLADLRDRLTQIGVRPYAIEPNSAEVGLLIPRELFHGMFDELVKELSTINRIVRAFAEAATGSAERVETHQITTTDPVFYLGMSAETAQMIGSVITWAITTWASVEGIRKIRSETQKNKSFDDDEIKTFFDSKVERTIHLAVEEKVQQILGDPGDKAGRAMEQRTDLAWALESVLTRVERGMTVELRVLPPPTQDAQGQPVLEPKVFQELRDLVPQLKFPAADPAPILQLPPAEPPSVTKLKVNS
jgi:hypothetical protein